MTDNKPYRTMRLALAMRGGVSLAVWIGGAVAELDLFRRACNGMDIGPDPNGHRGRRAERYRQLLEQTKKYNKVDIDILAGASAGGLNAVLFGLAQACDTVMDDTVRRTWIKDGGLWELLREPGSGRVESILRGDERLFEVVRDALGVIAGDLDPATMAQPDKRPRLTNGGSPAPRITVELAATLLDDPRHPERQNRARFSFSKTSGTLESAYSTIPASADRVRSEDKDKDKVDGEDPSVATIAKWRRQMALDRMALAARATSSFPGAFEPARIFSMRSGSASPGESAPLPSDYVTRSRVTVNMARTFLYSADRPEPFGVVDGGIFDNIPIDRAIRAIQRAAASEPSDRSLIYLDPEPPVSRGPVADVPEKTSAASWVPVIRSSLSLKQRQESAGDELSLVREYNDRVLQTRGRLEALAAIMRALRRSSVDPVGETLTFVADLVREESYTQCRIAMDAPRIAALLTEPWAELCYPPREAVDYAGLSPKAAIGIKNQVALAYNNPELRWQLSTDVVAMLDWVRVLIAWVRALEDLLVDYARWDSQRSSRTCGASSVEIPEPFRKDGDRDELMERLKSWKSALYRWLTVLGEARHRAVDEILVRPLRSENRRPDSEYPLITCLQESRGAQIGLSLTPELRKLLTEPKGKPEEIDSEMYRLLSVPNQFRYPDGDNLAATVRLGLDGILEEIRRCSGKVVEGLYDPGKEPDLAADEFISSRESGGERRGAIGSGLGAKLSQLGRRSTDGMRRRCNSHNDSKPAAKPEWLAFWAESVYPHFYLYPLSGYSIEQLAKIFASTGVPDTAHLIRFDSITGDERPRIPVPQLKEAAKAKHLGEWVRKRTPEARIVKVIKDTDGLLMADGKLAGNALSRFGGFFLWHWRENDWQWGRLDAAAGIARIIANRIDFVDDRCGAQAAITAEANLRRECIEENAQALQQEILAESGEQQKAFLVEPSKRKRGEKADTPPLVGTVGGESLSAISPRYRFALASRLVPLVYRALWPANSSPFSVGGALSRFGNIAVRPLAVALPLVSDPLRLAIAVITVLATAGALGTGVIGPALHGTAAAALLIVGALIAARTWRVGKNWRALRRTLDSINREYPQLGVEVEWTSLLRKAGTLRWRIASWVLVGGCLSLATAFAMGATDHLPLARFAATESVVAIFAVILGLQHWFNQRALRIVDPGAAVSGKKRTVMWTVTLLAGVAVILVPLLTSFPESAGFDSPPKSFAMAAVGTAALTAVSVWGWSHRRWASIAIAVAAALAAGVQLLLARIAGDNGLCDLAPVVVWLASVGAIIQRLPYREKNYGQPPLAEPEETAEPADDAGRAVAPGPPEPSPEGNGRVDEQLTGTTLRR
ncbi:DUF3376 domain-containing protein [Mycolicibacterium litorale]|uniref:DUF3376 domain-containing protein n=1 Tax=Mycolicibacterium litorale TaxID=758802 RepID=UPI003CEC3480